MSAVPLPKPDPDPAPEPVGQGQTDAEGWALLEALRRRLDDQGAQGRKTQHQVTQLAESIGALVAEQRRRSKWANLNSFVAYVLFTVLVGAGFYLLYRSRAHELVDARDSAQRERDQAMKRADDLAAKSTAREQADGKAWDVYQLLEAGKRSEAAGKLAALGDLPLSRTERAVLAARAHETQVMEVDAALKTAAVAFKAGRYADVVAPLEAALVSEPAGARASTMRYYLGVAYAKTNELEKATQLLTAAVAADVDQDDARFQLASVLDRAGQYVKARTEYDRFATAHPQSQLAVFAMRRSATLARMPAIAPAAVKTGAPAVAPTAIPPKAGAVAPPPTGAALTPGAIAPPKAGALAPNPTAPPAGAAPTPPAGAIAPAKSGGAPAPAKTGALAPNPTAPPAGAAPTPPPAKTVAPTSPAKTGAAPLPAPAKAAAPPPAAPAKPDDETPMSAPASESRAVPMSAPAMNGQASTPTAPGLAQPMSTSSAMSPAPVNGRAVGPNLDRGAHESPSPALPPPAPAAPAPSQLPSFEIDRTPPPSPLGPPVEREAVPRGEPRPPPVKLSTPSEPPHDKKPEAPKSEPKPAPKAPDAPKLPPPTHAEPGPPSLPSFDIDRTPPPSPLGPPVEREPAPSVPNPPRGESPPPPARF